MIPPSSQNSAVPESEQPAAFLLFVLCANFPANSRSPILQILCHLGSGNLAYRITAADRLYYVNVLVVHLPENFLPNALFTLCFGNQCALVMPFYDHFDSLFGDVFPRMIVGL